VGASPEVGLHLVEIRRVTEKSARAGLAAAPEFVILVI
jgi:hypothetical protein